jgi:acetate kinase
VRLSAEKVKTFLYKKPRLLYKSGISNDMRDLLASREPAAPLPVYYCVYRATNEIGALAAVFGGIEGAWY